MNWEVAILYLVAFILFQVLSQCRFRRLWKITWRVYWSNISTPAKQTLSLLKKERWGTSPLYPGSWRTLLAPHAHRHLALPVMRELGAAVRLGGPASESPAKCPCLGRERLERLKLGWRWEGIPWLYHSAPYDLTSPGPASSCTGYHSWSQEPRDSSVIVGTM